MTDPKTRLESVLSSRYLLGRELGRGGMATVYLAHDLRHDRDVALKVLHPELGAVIGADRFLAEIKVTARLQHPHILGLIDSGEADGLLFYVMPFVSGESLRVRLQREKQLPMPEALRIASEVASALHYAHRQGVVHRDIKPENILLHEGQALVADFGIALALTSAAGGRMTQTGMSLGTPHYMSPEQAMGERDITARSDVYALGAMTYEMVTGDPPFTGSTNQAITAKVLTEKPVPPSRIRDTVTPHVETAILVALAKLPADRWESTREFADALANPALTAGRYLTTVSPGYGAGVSPPSAGPPVRLTVLVALATLLIGGGLGWLLKRPPAPAATFPVEFTVEADSTHTLDTETSSAISLSPDGSRLAYVGRTSAGRLLYQRLLGEAEARPVKGTTGGSDPFYSPDGQWIAFEADRALKKVPANGGAPVTIVPGVGDIWGGTWDGEDRLVYSSGNPSALFMVSAEGGRPEQLTVPDSAQRESHGFPVHLPGGEAVLFNSLSRGPGGMAMRLGMVSIASRKVKFLDLAGIGPRYLASGEVMYALADGSILAQRFDLEKLEVTGAPRRIADGVGLALNAFPVFTAAPTGAVVFRAGQTDVLAAVLVSRTGAEEVLFRAPGLWSPRFSASGEYLAYARNPEDRTPGGRDIWIYSLKDRTSSRLTHRLQGAVDPAWSPDGRRIVYSATRGGTEVDLFVAAAGGGEDPTLLLERPGFQYQSVFSPDGSRIIFVDAKAGGATDISALDSGPGGTVETLVATSFPESAPAVSPDGRWLAYQSTETGQPEVYVRPFAGGGSRYMVSADGGREATWGRGGKEIFYRSGNRLMVAAVASGGQTFSVQERRAVFETPYLAGRGNRNYDIAPDGGSFLFVKSMLPPRLTVRLNALAGEPR